MEMWFVLSVLFVLLMSSFSFLTKKLLNDDFDPILYGAFMQFCTGVIALVFSIFGGFSFQITPVTIAALFFAGLTYTAGPALYYSGLVKVDLSKSVILDSLGIFWGLVMGLLILGESLTLEKSVAAIFIFTGICVISISRNFRLYFDKYELFILSSTLFYALGAAIDKYLVGYSNPGSYVAVSFLNAGIFMFVFFRKKLREKGRRLLSNTRFRSAVILNSLIVAISYRILFMAYDLGGEVSRVHAITLTQTVTVSVIGVIFLKERKGLVQKSISVFLTVIGLYLMNS